MSTPAPWGIPPTSPQDAAPVQQQELACPPAAGPGLGTLILVGLFATGVVQWISGRAKAAQEEEASKRLSEELDAKSFALEGAREDEQLRLTEAFAHRPMTPYGSSGPALPWGYPR